MRLIDADALEMNVQNEWERNEISNGDWIQFREWLKEMPTTDAVPVVHGWWIQNDNGTWSCNRCHSWIPDEQHYYARYCLYCGAKMDGGDHDA